MRIPLPEKPDPDPNKKYRQIQLDSDPPSCLDPSIFRKVELEKMLYSMYKNCGQS